MPVAVGSQPDRDRNADDCAAAGALHLSPGRLARRAERLAALAAAKLDMSVGCGRGGAWRGGLGIAHACRIEVLAEHPTWWFPGPGTD